MMSKGSMAPGRDDERTIVSGDLLAPAETLVSSELASQARTIDSQVSPLLGAAPPGDSVPPESLSAIFAGTPRFAPRELIGEGGMGAVLRAFDKDLQRDVAVKVLTANSDSGAEIERFVGEARITGQLEHPFIVPVYEFGIDERGARFLCMKLVQGETLEDTLTLAGDERLKPDRLADLLQIFVKVCDAVAFAHSRGVIHRDLKPSNVMIGEFGQVYVMDWGLARALNDASEPLDLPGAVVGTPSYMAPEQLAGKHDELDERTDVFMLGAILFEILTAQAPRPPGSVRAVLLGETRARIPHPDEVVPGGRVPAELSRIALKAMADDPRARHASVNELKLEIERFQRGAWHLPQQTFAAGALIVAQGEPGETAYIIAEGRCTVFREEGGREFALRELGPGEVFGETAVFSNKPRTAGVRALTDVTVLTVTTEVLSNALGLNFWMGGFVRALAERFREIDERLRGYEQERRERRG
jgi:eukaryotic-like serine/threonine-protein kinase